MGMHAYGRTLRRAGDLGLLALPIGDGRDRYYLTDGPALVATSASLEQALAAFAAMCDATDAAAPRQRLAASGVIDLAAERARRRPFGDAPAGRPPAGPEAP